MTSESLPIRRPPFARPLFPRGGAHGVRRGTAILTSPAVRPHLVSAAVFVALAVWLTRSFLFSSALPAGTDMLDLLARARQNADLSTLTSAWSPSGLGSERQTSLDNAVGLLTMVMGSPVRAVVFLMLTLLVTAGASTYLLAYRWYRSPLAAGTAGVLYMTSQAMLGRVASGWLHYELLMALAPAVVLVFVAIVDHFTVRLVLVLAVLASAICFARQDMILWIGPALGLYIVVAAATARRPLIPLAHVFAAFTVLLPTVLALSAYLLLPLSAGIHAPWFSTGQVFEAIRFNLLDRSLSAYQSVLGLGRDLGYLPSSGQEWWKSHPWVPLPVYYGAQATLVAAACAALRWYRDRRTLFLLATITVTSFLAKGVRGPIGEPYWWAVQHLPVFGNLRGPNRWLIPGVLATSVLAGLTLDRVVRETRRRAVGTSAYRRAQAHIGIVGLVGVLLLPVAPTLVSGLQSWSPTPGQLALMRAVPNTPDSFTVASTPYGQSMRFVNESGYRGWEHDLGVESSLFTGRSAVSTNSWDRRGSDFVDFTAGLLARGDPAFVRLLGAAGVKYLLSFTYPPSAPELIAQSESVPRYQQKAVAAFRDLRTTARNAAGTLYSVPESAPLVTFRSNVAVVLGGRSGLAALADLPGINLKDWATFVADDVLTGQDGSATRLAGLIRRANLVMVSGASVEDLALLATPPVVRVAGITSNGADERRVGLLLTDQSARRGSLADQSILPPPLESTARQEFRLRRPERLELWTRVLVGPDAGVVTYLVDGRSAGHLRPLAPGNGGFRWVRITSRLFAAGRHEVDVVGSRSTTGASFEVDESRLIRPAEKARNAKLLDAAIASARGRIALSVDLSSVEAPANERTTTARPIGARQGFWHVQDRRGVRSRTTQVRTGEALRLELVGDRRFFTVAYHDFATPRSFVGQGNIALRFLGTGSGQHYDLLVDSDRRHQRFLSFGLIDSVRGWQTALVPVDPTIGAWRHVVGLRIATKLKTSFGVLSLTTPTVPFPRTIAIAVRTISETFGRPMITGPARGARMLVRSAKGSRRDIRVVLPISLAGRDLRLVVPPRSMPRALPATTVASVQKGSSVPVQFRTKTPGVLVFNQAYDPKWRLKTDAGVGLPATPPVSALTAGFAVEPGTYSGVIELDRGSLAGMGMVISVAALLVVLGLIAAWPRGALPTATDVPTVPSATPAPVMLHRAALVALAAVTAAHFSLPGAALVVVVAFVWWKQGWQLMLGTTLTFLGIGVFFSGVQRPDLADECAVLFLLALSLVLGRLLLLERRRTG